MAYFKPTTPTSAGLAQVFDTSSYKEEERADAKEERLRMQERLNKTQLQYDPRGMHKSHIPAYQKLMNEYLQFIGNNETKLLNAGENTQTWLQKQQLENQIKNVVAGSIQYNQDLGNGLKMTLNNESYMNPDNEKMVDTLDNIIWTKDQVLDGTAYMPVQSNLKRNYMVDERQIVADLQKKVIGDTELIQGGEYDIKRVSGMLDSEAADEYLFGLYNSGTRDGGDIRSKYKTPEEFARHMKSQVVTGIEEQYIRNPEAKEPTATDRKVATSFSPVSVQNTYVAMPRTTTTTTKGGFLRSDKTTSTTSTEQVRLQSNGAYALNTDKGGGTTITVQIPEAYDLGKNTELTMEKAYTTLKVLDVAQYRFAEEAIELQRDDGGIDIIQPGEPLPDKFSGYSKMTPEAWRRAEAKTMREEMARAVGGDRTMNLIAELGYEQAMEILQKEGGQVDIFLVPYNKVAEALANEYDKQVGIEGAYYAQRDQYLNSNTRLTP